MVVMNWGVWHYMPLEDVWPTYTPLSIASAGLATDPPSLHVQWPIGGSQGRHHLRQTN